MQEALKRRREAGVTLIELMMVLAVAVIFLTLGVPSLADFVRETRLSSTMNQLTSALFLARSEAIKRNARVLVCARSTPASSVCSTSGAAADWMNGWLVCYDANADGACDATSTSDPNPIRAQAALSASMVLAGPTTAVVFFPVGSANAASTFTMTGGTTTTRTATVAASGAVASSKS